MAKIQFNIVFTFRMLILSSLLNLWSFLLAKYQLSINIYFLANVNEAINCLLRNRIDCSVQTMALVSSVYCRIPVPVQLVVTVPFFSCYYCHLSLELSVGNSHISGIICNWDAIRRTFIAEEIFVASTKSLPSIVRDVWQVCGSYSPGSAS